MNELTKNLSNKTGLSTQHIELILKLLDEGATIPYIARYRKDKIKLKRLKVLLNS